MIAKIIVFIIGAVFVAAGILVARPAIAERSKHDSWKAQDGIVVARDVVKMPATATATRKGRHRSGGYLAVVSYEYTHDKITFKGEISPNGRAETKQRAYDKIAHLEVGQKIPVLVDPSNPGQSVARDPILDSNVGTYVASIAFIVIGIVISTAAATVKI